MYNIFFTALPIMWYAVFDYEHEKSTLIQNPDLYEHGLQKRFFNFRVFWGWVLYAFWQAFLIISFVTFVSQSPESVMKDGHQSTFWAGGMLVYAVCIILVNFVLMVRINNFTGWCELIILLHILFFALILYFETHNKFFPQIYGLWAEIMSSPINMLGCLLVIGSIFTVDKAWEIYQNPKILESLQSTTNEKDKTSAESISETASED